MESKNKNIINFLRSRLELLALISNNKILIDTFEVDEDVEIYLVDDIDTLSNVDIYKILINRLKKSFVFVNNNFDEAKFLNTVTERIFNVFDKENIFFNVVVYPKHDFPNKEALKCISSINLFNQSKVEMIDVNSIFYVGQYGTSGYATAAKGYIAEYVTKNIPISWHPLKFDLSKLDTSNYVNILAESAINRPLYGKDQIILHCTPDLWPTYIRKFKCEYYKRVVGYCTWESNKLPTKWADYINLLPEVWVPSSYNKTVFENCGVKSKISIVPHVWFAQKVVDKKNITIIDCFGNEISKTKYTFYSIGEFTTRKSIEELVNVFNKLNDEYSDTQLLLKLHYKDYTTQNANHIINKLKSITDKLGKSIHIILNTLSEQDVLNIHSFGDCYVSLSKGEGFGLTIFDAYNLGKKVITTGYGGPIDFLGKDYPGLVNYKLHNVEGMEEFSTNYTSDQEWAYPDLEHAYELMEKQCQML